VDCDGTPLTKDTHYTVAWSGDGVADGNYTVTVRGMDPYYGSQAITYTVRSTERLGEYDFRLGADDDGLYYKVDCAKALVALSAYTQNNNCSGKHFVQTADITLTGTFAPIGGNSSDNTDGFYGTYDGGGHTTSGLNVMVTSSDWSNSAVAGLFGRVRMGGVVRNVGLVSPAVSCTTNKENRAGAIVGCVDVDGFVTHCFVLNPCSVTASGASNNYARLFVGQKYDGTFANLYYYGTASLPMCG